MAGYATYLKNAFLNALLNNTSFAVAQVYISLHTGDPGDTGASEVAGGSYARQPTSFAAASGGTGTTDTAEEFLGMPAATVTHVGIWDALSGGNFLGGGALTSSVIVGAGDSIAIAAGDLDLHLNS